MLCQPLLQRENHVLVPTLCSIVKSCTGAVNGTCHSSRTQPPELYPTDGFRIAAHFAIDCRGGSAVAACEGSPLPWLKFSENGWSGLPDAAPATGVGSKLTRMHADAERCCITKGIAPNCLVNHQACPSPL